MNKETITLPRIQPAVDDETKRQLQLLADKEHQVVLHCRHTGNPFGGSRIRIWKSTFLLPHHSSHKCQLIHTEKVSIAPKWTWVHEFETFTFTLVFSGLPKDCVVFDLVEDIPEPNGFVVTGIARNRSDVYLIDL